MTPPRESSRRLQHDSVLPCQLVSSSPFLFLSKTQRFFPLPLSRDYLLYDVGILRFLHMTLETLRELFHVMNAPSVKHMCVGEEVVPVLQGPTVVVPPEEEEVPVPQGPTVMVPQEE
jgi:hypothetical protein